MKTCNQRGSLHLGMILAVVVVAAVAFAGYRVWGSQQDSAATTPVTQTASTVPAAIHNKADLAQTGKALDQAGSELDSSLNDASLNNDINSML